MRLIDADALEAKQKTIYMEYDNVAVPTKVIPIFDLYSAPTFDAVEVVRCKDCIHSEFVAKDDEAYNCITYDRRCMYWDSIVKRNGFCYNGERKMDTEG